jgi:hypothetical protein
MVRALSGPGTLVKHRVDLLVTSAVSKKAILGGRYPLRNLAVQSLNIASGLLLRAFMFLVVLTSLSLEPPAPNGNGTNITEKLLPKAPGSLILLKFTGIAPNSSLGTPALAIGNSATYLKYVRAH